MASPLNVDAIAAASIGAFTFLGVIVATTTKNNSDTAAAFNASGDALTHKVLLVQTDTECYIRLGADATITAVASATSASFRLAAGASATIHMGAAYGYIACIAASGTSNLKVWGMT